MEFLLVLIGLILIVEGLPYAAFPEAMQRWLAQMQQLSPVTLRKAGLVMLGLGLLLISLARRTNFFS